VTAAGGAAPRVGVVLVSHSAGLAEQLARMALGMAGAGGTGEVCAAGGTADGGLGTSAELIESAIIKTGAAPGSTPPPGVVVLADLGSSVLTVKSLLLDADDDFPFPVRLADAPFAEGAVAAVVTAAAGADLTEVLRAAEDARDYRKR
jgi:dihydroxyacetone kinase DhaKLM complex PTS-EIIA-like component DhaM